MQGDRRPEFDSDELMRSLRDSWESFRARLPGNGGTSGLVAVVIAVIAFIWLATGVYIVGPGEQAAVQLFGQFRGLEEPGLKWYFPAPIGSRTIENIQETKEMQVGFRVTPQRRPVVAESTMITGDLNIVNIEMVVQYRIVDLPRFLFRVSDPGDLDRGLAPGRPDGRTLLDATEAALRQVIGQRSIDDVLTVARAAVEEDTRTLLQLLMEDYETGIQVLDVVLQDVRPPDEVRSAFDDVVSARLDQESRINQARAFEQDRLPRAQGAAQQTIQAAQAFQEARIAEARGEAAQFTSIWTEYQQSPDVTRQRLFLESMERVLPRVRIFLLHENNNGGNGVLPLLPLSPMMSSSPAAPTSPSFSPPTTQSPPAGQQP